MIQPTNAQAAYPQGGANAVSINIFNPQAYASAPQAQTVPYDQSYLYNIPQASVYQPQQGVVPFNYPQYIPQYIPQQIPQYVPQQIPQYIPQQIQYPEQPIVMPQVIQYPEVPQAAQVPEAQVITQAPVAPQPGEMPQSVIEQAPAPEVQTAPETTTVDVNALVDELKSEDNAVKSGAIDKIAEYVQSEPDVALQVVSEPIMQGLVNIINEDTTGLEGPTDEQVKVAQKVAKGETLTPEENALAEQLSPRDLANKNRIFALYTLAMIQKLQRDELDQYIEAQKANGQETIEPLKIQDLIGYSDIVNVIQNDSRPEVKIAAIQALKYIAKLEDEATVKEILTAPLNSKDSEVKAAAQEVVDMYAKAA